MEKYLSSLLELNNRVIVPDLGAFIIRQQDPKELVFNDLLAFDDGLLTEHLIREEKLTKSEAQNRIKQFVDKVKTVLQKGDQYPLKNLGTLTMDASSRINFLTPDTPAPEPAGKPDETDETEAAGPQVEADAEAAEAEGPVEDTATEETAAAGPQADTDAEAAEAEGPVQDVATEETEAAGPDLDTEKEAAQASVQDTETEVIKSDKVEDGGFELQEEDAAVDIDTASEESVTEEPEPGTRAEEPPFLIEEQEAEEAEGAEPSAEQEAGEEGKDKKEDKEEDNEKEIEQKIAALADLEKEMEEEEDGEEEIPAQFRQALAEEPTGDESVPIEEFLREEQNKVKVEGVPVNLEPDDTSSSSYAQPARKRRVWPWILGSVLLILAILAAGWYFYPDTLGRILPERLMQKITREETGNPGGSAGPSESGTEAAGEAGIVTTGNTDQAASSGEPSEPEKEKAGTDAVPATGGGSEELAAEEIPPAPATGKRYYVVAGCFADLGNAENYVRTLRAQGYDASIFGKRDNLHAVCFSSFSSKKAADEEVQRIRRSYDPSAWVLYY